MDAAVNNERILIERAREGDTSSFSQLVRIYQERAVHAAYSFLGNYEDARDVAQEAFIKCYHHLSNFKNESRFYTWFYRILANACKDFLRKKKVRKNIFFWLDSGEDPENETDPILNVAENRKNARESLINQELGGALYEALEKLPLQQKSAFSLRYLEGLGMEDIADSMDLSVGTVKATLWQAAQKMRKLMGSYLECKEGVPCEKPGF